MSAADHEAVIRLALVWYVPETRRDPRQTAVLASLDALVRLLQQAEQERRRVPNDEGGPGHEESYWLRAKLQASITHLRDVEDFYRLRGGLPEGSNMIRADRARDLYETITEDFVNGKTTRETRAEAEARAERAEQERDEAQKDAILGRYRYEAAEARVRVLEEALREIAAADGYREPATFLVARAQGALAAAAAPPEEVSGE